MELALATSLPGDINSFALAPTPGFLAALIAELQVLHKEVAEPRDRQDKGRHEILNLRGELTALKSRQDVAEELLGLDTTLDRHTKEPAITA
jgi:hypothetical protein